MTDNGKKKKPAKPGATRSTRAKKRGTAEKTETKKTATVVDNTESEQNQPPNHQGEGGASGLTERREFQLERRAVSQRWPIPEEYRKPLVDRATRIAMNPRTPDRSVLQAIRTLAQMEQMNQADEHKQEPERHFNGVAITIDNRAAEILRAVAQELSERTHIGRDRGANGSGNGSHT